LLIMWWGSCGKKTGNERVQVARLDVGHYRVALDTRFSRAYPFSRTCWLPSINRRCSGELEGQLHIVMKSRFLWFQSQQCASGVYKSVYKTPKLLVSEKLSILFMYICHCNANLPVSFSAKKDSSMSLVYSDEYQ
jgi:hypothetical protein